MKVAPMGQNLLALLVVGSMVLLLKSGFSLSCYHALKKKQGFKVLLGDNLSSYVSFKVLEACD